LSDWRKIKQESKRLKLVKLKGRIQLRLTENQLLLSQKTKRKKEINLVMKRKHHPTGAHRGKGSFQQPNGKVVADLRVLLNQYYGHGGL